MNRRNLAIGAVVVVVVFFLFLSSVFVVNPTQQALVLQFGNFVRTVREPGLSGKVPFIQSVEYFEKRVLSLDASSIEVILGDQKRLVVDAFVRYRIADPLLFRQAAGTETAFRGRLEPLILSNLRSVLGNVSLFQVLSTERGPLMNTIRVESNKSLRGFGVELVDVRIKRADLPPENSQAIFARMRAERDREAKELRAQGAEIGQRIRARADRERRVIIADAARQGQITRGQGDAEATRTFAEAVGQDVSFFDFYRSMQAYRTALTDGQTNLVLSPTSRFFRYFDTLQPREGSGPDNQGVDQTARRAPGPRAGPTMQPSAAPAAQP